MHTPECICCRAEALGGDPALAWRTTVQNDIAQYGWSVQGVINPTGAFLYTIGLTLARQPELVVFDVPKPKIQIVHGLINVFARHHLTENFRPGRSLTLAGITAEFSAVTRRENFGGCNLLFGRGRYLMLQMTLDPM